MIAADPRRTSLFSSRPLLPLGEGLPCGPGRPEPPFDSRAKEPAIPFFRLPFSLFSLLSLLIALPLALASCGTPPALHPAEPPPPCPPLTAALPPTASATPTAVPAPSVAAVVALPRAPLFDVDKPARTQKLALTELKSKRTGAASYSVVPVSAGGAWLVPQAAGKGEALFAIDAAGRAKEAWTAGAATSLLAAAGSDDSLLVAGTPGMRGTFPFPRLARVFKLSMSGKIEADHPFTAGTFSPLSALAGPSGSLFVAGTLASTLTTERGPLTPEAGGRAEVLVALGPDGKASWAEALARTSGRISAFAVSPDGSAALVSSPFLGDQVLTALSPGGKVAWEKPLTARPPARFPTPAIEAIASDGRGGYFVQGPSSDEGGLDLGLGPLTGSGSFVARLDAQGRCLWERLFKADQVISSDGAGSFLAVPGYVESEVPRAYEIDPDGRVARAIDIELPAACRATKHPITVQLAGGMTPTTIFVAVVCQAQDETSMPQLPVGKPAVFTGSLPRK